ncbi:FAD-dependent oxidoreductase [Flavihumibacter rivuli]|uniref:flavin monoamine oxidase family protein n=1 Tax=Flavihumibacter rivuli TaxID=2838156 RepID=UPI001BDF016B|nr:FAD-dependent oxidoreductase [Flavihumibacter rivuli]ULQ57685.1 FAD-dependent oxidoreductase [Flavihumibacter rivuli]
MKKTKSTTIVYDIAVVGGGVSGVYTAWRLMTANPASSALLKKMAGKDGKLRIALFEGSDRIGGRLLSARPPGFPNMVCEIGGMRYVSSQLLVSSLVENELKLPTHEQVVDQPINIVYTRGTRLRNYQLSDPGVLPYQLSAKEKAWLSQGNTASNLIGWAVEQLFPQVAKLSGEKLEKFLQQATLDGTPLYEYGFWNILAKVMSNEAYQVARTTVGYDSLGMNANAVNCIAEYFNFTPDVKYYLFNEGYDSVPWALQQRFEAAGGEVIMNTWLQGFDEIKMADGSRGVEMQFAGNNTNYTVQAKALVLAMPKRSLELLEQKGPVMDPHRAPHVRYLMNAVEPVDLYKMFLAYPRPWWEKAFVTQGRSLTDIPVRQCYYWGVEGRQTGGDPNNTNALLMAYDDMSSSEFWGGMRNRPLGSGDAVRWTTPGNKLVKELMSGPRNFDRKKMPHAQKDKNNDWGKRLRENWDKHTAPKKMVEEMHRQLGVIHNISDAPAPMEAAFKDWSDDPYGGAVHFWNPGYKPWEVLQAMTQPVSDFPCFVVGEAYSTNQTWVEGALQTAEIVLQKHFKLLAPKWLKNGK